MSATPATPAEPPVERVRDRPLEQEMHRSYIDYAMSVIVGRALPDGLDGLKPVHRRILWSMWESGATHDRAYRKSARTVGDVLGKYHPHGDLSVYDALVRMAQPFSLRYPLIDGQGNFGSIDGDGPAAMRYTEARLSTLAEEMLLDIEKETVDWTDNFDGSLKEPLILPSKVPNLLVNGSAGIAVGMATNMPPHNLGEIVDALCLLLANPGASLDELMKVVPGPDFPTGGYLSAEGIRDAYETGRAMVHLRGSAEIRERGGKDEIVITEIPYEVNKASLLELIAELVKSKRIDGITDLRDESDRSGTSVVLELRRDAPAEIVLNRLYEHTPLETSFGVINLCLVEGRPKVLGLKALLELHLDPPAQDDHAPYEVRPEEDRGAAPPPRGVPHRDRPHRRGDPDHPPVEGRGGRGDEPDGQVPALDASRRRRSSTCASPGSPPSSARRSRRRSPRRKRSCSSSRRCSRPRRSSTGSSSSELTDLKARFGGPATDPDRARIHGAHARGPDPRHGRGRPR